MTTLSYASDQKAKTSLRPSRQAIRRAALAFALALGVAGAVDFGHYYLTTGRYLETTDDAYVKADSTIIAPKVSGYISEVLVVDNEPVLIAANKRIEVLSTDRARAVAQLDHARAVEQQAALNLSYTQITAPVNGTVGARSLRVGQYVQAGTQLMAVVPLDAVYVVANFKETQLTHVRNGQPVELYVDSFQTTRLKGHVDSLSPASGLEFALLPPDNATGNFTKIVQRVPVKIVLDDQSLNGLLRPGMSAVPTVNTKSAAVAGRDIEKRLASRGP
jgi:multidrug resistance efflux pump